MNMLKKRLDLLIYTFVTISTLTFPLSSFGISITYRTTFRQTEGGNRLTCDNVLDIGDSSSCFYCPKSYKMTLVSDSISRIGGTAYDAVDVWRQQHLLGPKFPYTVFKDYPQKGQIAVAHYDIMYIEDMPELDWELADGDTMILGHHAYEARTRYRGRVWTAYYAPDIAVGEGPWKLCGLPGLILLARDSTDTYRFEAVGISNTLSRNTLESWRHDMKRTTVKQMINLIKLNYMDYEKYLFQTMGMRAQSFDAQGRRKKPDNKVATLIEYPE